MAEIITLQSAVLPILQAAAQKIADAYGGVRGDETNWMVHCPLHDDQQASCHVKITDRLLVYCHVCGKKKQGELIQKLKDDNLWVALERKPDEKSKEDIPQSNIPAHAIPDKFPQFLHGKDRTAYPVTQIWTYYTALGHPAFWVLRGEATDDAGKRRKIIMWMSSFTENGVSKFKMRLQCKSRPLYELPKIINSDGETIIVVEGEKTADAAIDMFEHSGQNYLVTTWSGGAQNWRSTDLSPLHGKDVVFWPDNDKTSIAAMLDVSSIIKNSRIVFQEVQEKLPLKWDLADPIPNDVDIYKMLEDAQPPVLRVREIKTQNTVEYLREKWQRMENGRGGIEYVDTQSRSPKRKASDPFITYSKVSLQEAYTELEYEITDKGVKPRKVIDKYLDNPEQPIAYTYIFDPTTSNVRVTQDNVLFLNTFMGFEHKPIESDPVLYQTFIDHVNGILGEAEAVWFLDWIADIFQNIVRKPGVMPIFSGKPGTGKSIIGDVITSMLGRHVAVCIPCGAIFDSKFNGMLTDRVFVSLDELNLYGATNKHANENLKTLVTDRYITLNEKYVRQRTDLSYHRYMGTTNVNMPVTIDMSDRRYALFSVKDVFINNSEHFNKIVAMMKDPIALSGLAYYFMNRNITTVSHSVPQTEARAIVQRPEDPVMDTLFSILNEGHLPEEIRMRCHQCEWPKESMFIPRSIFNEYIKKKHPSISPTRISLTLLPMLMWDRSDGRYNNTRRQTIMTPDGRGVMEVNERVFEFKPIYKLRGIYESVTNTKPRWQEITFDETDDIDQKPVEPF